MWVGSRKQGGTYGFFQGDDKLWLAHRWVWTYHHGPIAAGLEVMHSCNNPSCVEIDHLSLGTRQQNAKRGKLSNAEVEEIRSIYAGGQVLQQTLADLYGVWDSQISRIVNHKRRREANCARPDDAPTRSWAFAGRKRIRVKAR